MEKRTKSYFRLIKPGITLSNVMAGFAGFMLALSVVKPSLAEPNTYLVFVGALGGMALIIASACVFNNILDRKMDARMKRTVGRDVANGKISVPAAVIYGTILGLAGFLALGLLTNLLTLILGAIAYIWYVLIYDYSKRTTAYSTLIGGVAGSLPPVAGYTAMTGSIDMAAVSLFLILYLWQLPHFYAISIFRKQDYAEAKVPVWSIVYGDESAKRQIFITVVLYAISAALLFAFGYAGWVYLAASSALSIYWIYRGIKLYKKADPVKWSRSMFGISLLVLMAMSLVIIPAGGFLV